MDNPRKTIFFLSPFYLDLYKDIVTELEKEYTVFLFEDKIIKSKYSIPDTLQGLKKLIKFTYNYLFNPWLKYWKRQIRINTNFNKRYDIFFCINGHSFHPFIIEHLIDKNPQLQTVLYLWDDNRGLNFSKKIKYFDKIITFDRHDAESFNIEYLPFYWIDNNTKNISSEKGVFFIGANHDDRYWILKKVIAQLDATRYPYYIKLVVTAGRKSTIISFLEYCYYFLFSKKEKIEYLNVFFGKYAPDFVVSNPVPPHTFNKIMAQYDCVLDTERPDQNGLTFRAIWAIAKNKKLITTNSNIVKENFYTPEMILVIDRNNPVIPQNFLEKTIDCSDTLKALVYLRIDNWIKTILTFNIND